MVELNWEPEGEGFTAMDGRYKVRKVMPSSIVAPKGGWTAHYCLPKHPDVLLEFCTTAAQARLACERVAGSAT